MIKLNLFEVRNNWRRSESSSSARSPLLSVEVASSSTTPNLPEVDYKSHTLDSGKGLGKQSKNNSESFHTVKQSNKAGMHTRRDCENASIRAVRVWELLKYTS